MVVGRKSLVAVGGGRFGVRDVGGGDGCGCDGYPGGREQAGRHLVLLSHRLMASLGPWMLWRVHCSFL